MGIARNWSWEGRIEAQRAKNGGRRPRSGVGVLGEGQRRILGMKSPENACI